MKSQREKMLGGELYDPLDSQLCAERRRARLLFKALNDTADDQQEERARLIKELIPASGEGVWIEPPFYCDYGTNITLGDRVFFNFNCVVLDVAPVRVGSGVLFGPAVQIYAATHPLSAAERRTGLELGRVVEVLRIDVTRGHTAQMLPQLEERLAKVESWWRQHCADQRVPEAPDPVFLARGIISTLDIAVQTHFAQRDWESALRRIDAILEMQRAMEHPVEEIAPARMNRAIALSKLGRFSEAQAELEDCLQVFQHDPANSAKVLSSLASLFKEQGDMAQAITQQRRALALFEQLPYPRDRATSHDNLANYLERSDEPSALVESPRHQLAALIYRLNVGLGQDLQHLSLVNYAIRFRRANVTGATPAVPRVAELLTDTAFRPVDEWLRQRQVDVDELQAAVDQFLGMARQAALGQE